MKVVLPQLALFEMDPLPTVLPERKEKEPPPKKECPECGRPVKRFGDLCERCIIRRPLPEEARVRVCCRLLKAAGCPPGECYAIPF